MPTPLTPNSRVVKAIVSHIETGIPIDPGNYHLTPDELQRITAVFHLYKSWRKNPMIDKHVFLKEVHGRRSQDIPNDLYCFDVIKSMSADLMMNKDDLMLIQQRAALSAYQTAKDLGDTGLMLKAAKMLGDIVKEMPETQEKRVNELGDFYSNDIRDIAPDFIPVDSSQRRKMLQKYGGTPDKNTELVESKVARLREQEAVAVHKNLRVMDTESLPDDEDEDYDMFNLTDME